MSPNEGMQNYRPGMNPEYDRMHAEACRAESEEAQKSRMLRDAPLMMNTHRPLFDGIEKPAPRPSLWKRFVAFFR